MSNNCLFGVMYNWVLQCHNWLCLALDCLGKRRDPCPLKLNRAPIFTAAPVRDSLLSGRHSLIRQSCGYPSLHDRAPTIIYCSASLSFIGIDLIQNLPPDGRIKIIKFTAGFCGRPHYGYTLLVIRLFVNFLALLQSQSCQFRVIWNLAVNW